MKIKKLGLSIITLSIMTGFTLTGCEQTRTVEVEDNTPDTVIVPDQKDNVDINVHSDTQPAPNIIEKNTQTNTTTDSTGQIQSQTKTESTTVH